MYLVVKDNGYEGHSATEFPNLKEVRKHIQLAETNWGAPLDDFEIYKVTKKLDVKAVVKSKEKKK